MSTGIPIKILHESIGSDRVTVEMDSGETFCGRVTKIEDNMNTEMEKVTHTYPNGKTRSIPTVYLRGSNIVFFITPEELQNSPIVQSSMSCISKSSSRGAGKGFGGRGRDAGRGRGSGKRPRTE